MVARLKRKFPLGMSDQDAMDFLNEAYRKINQTSKAGYIWQVRATTITVPVGAATDLALPTDFDPGKSAWLRNQTIFSTQPTNTIIPYKPFKEFFNQEHFSTTNIMQFAAWSFRPIITGAPTTYSWVMNLRPSDAFPLTVPVTFDLTYHSATFAPIAIGAANYFPTPGQFDSLIIDLAEAEYSRIYGKAGWEKIQQQALSGVMEIIDTYRTDRYNLSGISDLAIQAQERQSAKTK
jgi:hypothetical protein